MTPEALRFTRHDKQTARFQWDRYDLAVDAMLELKFADGPEAQRRDDRFITKFGLIIRMPAEAVLTMTIVIE